VHANNGNLSQRERKTANTSVVCPVMPGKVALLPVIKAFVEANGWKIATEDKNAVVMIFGGSTDESKADHYVLTISGRDEQQDITVKVMCCEFSSATKRKRIAEFCARASFGLKQYDHNCYYSQVIFLIF
jgi:hypothetical protein